MFLPPIAALLAALLLPAPAHAAGGGAGWRLPLSGPTVVRGFSFERDRPFRAGQRRVVSLAGRPGEPVRAPCPGPVSFAGGLPGGQGVSIRCGRLSATLTGLGSVTGERGEAVAAGQPVGRLGPGARLGFGARVANRRHGYLDPLRLVAPDSGPAPLAPALRPGRPLRPAARTAGRSRPGIPVPVVLLGVAWLGLGLAGTALGVGVALGAAGLAGRPVRRAHPAGR